MAAPRSRRMTWQDICRAYPDEFVLVTEPDHDPAAGTLRAATVLAHGRHRGRLLAAHPRTNTDERAVYYTGKVTPRRVLALAEAVAFTAAA